MSMFNNNAFDVASIGYVDFKFNGVTSEDIDEISISDTQPMEETIQLWVNTNADMVSIPEIKDNEISVNDTWSSQKISEAFDEVRRMIEGGDSSILGQAILGKMILGKGE